jgi:pilus assembly protein CpaB
MKSARIVVLGIAVAAGGLAALLMAGGSEPPAPAPAAAPAAKLDLANVLVAKKDIGIGQSISAADLGWQEWPAGSVSPQFIKRGDRADAIEQIAGSISRTPIASGEPIREAGLIKAKGSGYMAAILPSGMRAFSTEISAETGAGGFILPNDHVDVILSRRDRDAERATGVEAHVSETILTDVRVLAIDQTVEDKNGQKVVVGKTATLELTQRQSETLALSRQLGTLTLALRSLADSTGKEQATTVDPKDATSRMNMVRFGVTTTTIPK